MCICLFGHISIKTYDADEKVLLYIYFDSDDEKHISKEGKMLMQNRLINTSEDVLSCTVHPFNGTIIAGTKVLFIFS
jgi:hypothetical protein